MALIGFNFRKAHNFRQIIQRHYLDKEIYKVAQYKSHCKKGKQTIFWKQTHTECLCKPKNLQKSIGLLNKLNQLDHLTNLFDV